MPSLGTENANGAQNQQKRKSKLQRKAYNILINFSDVHVMLIFMQPLKHHDEPRRKISAPAYRPGRRDSVVAVHTNRRASVAAPRRFNRRGSEVLISLDNLQDFSMTTVFTFNKFIGTCSNYLLTEMLFTLFVIHCFFYKNVKFWSS